MMRMHQHFSLLHSCAIFRGFAARGVALTVIDNIVRGPVRKNRLFKYAKPGANILQVQSRAHSKTLEGGLRVTGQVFCVLGQFKISFFYWFLPLPFGTRQGQMPVTVTTLIRTQRSCKRAGMGAGKDYARALRSIQTFGGELSHFRSKIRGSTHLTFDI